MKIPLSLPTLLHTKIGISSTLEYIEETKIVTRKWYLGQEEDISEEGRIWEAIGSAGNVRD